MGKVGPLLNRGANIHFCDERDGVIVVVDNYGVRFNNKEMRKSLYRMFTYVKYGHLGRGVRIPLPKCVTSKIQRMFPAQNGNYMGFKEVSAQHEI